MEWRLDPRFASDLPAVITDLANPSHNASGRILNLSESGLCIEVEVDFPVRSIIKIQQSDCVLFGHVVYCRHEDSSLRLGVEVVRVLIGESDLGRLFDRVLAESMPAIPGVGQTVH